MFYRFVLYIRFVVFFDLIFNKGIRSVSRLIFFIFAYGYPVIPAHKFTFYLLLYVFTVSNQKAHQIPMLKGLFAISSFLGFQYTGINLGAFT